MNQPSATRLVVVAALLLGIASVLTAPAGTAGAPKKTFHVTLAKDDGSGFSADGSTVPLVAGSSPTLRFTLSNDASSTQPFGSARLTPPAGITLTNPTVNTDDYSVFHVTVDGTGALLVTSTGPTGTGVPPGGKPLLVTATAAVTSACPSAWLVQIKQSNDFSGHGNDFSTTDVISTPVGSPRLVFTTQPTVTQFVTAMSPAPVVGALDACGNVLALDGTIQLTDTAGAIATGGGTLTAASGVVTVSGLTFSSYGIYDRLQAAKSGYTSAVSSPFPVAQVVETCNSTSSCPPVSLPGTDTSALIKTLGGAKGDYVSGSVTDDGTGFATCEAQKESETGTEALQVGDTVVVDTPRGKTVTVTIPKDVVNEVPNNGTPFYDVCLDIPLDLQTADNSFVDKFDNTTHQGLLPDCVVSTDTGPCVVSRQKKGGAELITFNLPAGDPRNSVW